MLWYDNKGLIVLLFLSFELITFGYKTQKWERYQRSNQFIKRSPQAEGKETGTEASPPTTPAAPEAEPVPVMGNSTVTPIGEVPGMATDPMSPVGNATAEAPGPMPEANSTGAPPSEMPTATMGTSSPASLGELGAVASGPPCTPIPVDPAELVPPNSGQLGAVAQGPTCAPIKISTGGGIPSSPEPPSAQASAPEASPPSGSLGNQTEIPVGVTSGEPSTAVEPTAPVGSNTTEKPNLRFRRRSLKLRKVI
ncbi:hypothetical protein DFH28DRAFT_1104352, partial [Melampsora americana]